MELAVVIAGIFLLYLLQVAAYRLYWDKGLSVQFFFQREPVREGEQACLYERLTNRKRLPLPVLYVMFDMSRNGRACQKNASEEEEQVKSFDQSGSSEEMDSGNMGFEKNSYVENVSEKAARERKLRSRMKRTWFLSEILSLRSNEEKERKIAIKGLKRGLYRIPELRLTASNLFLTDRFSVAATTSRKVQQDDVLQQNDGVQQEGIFLRCESNLYVYPKILPEQELSPLFQLLSDTYLTERYSYEDDFEIRGIREYQSFDPMKRVNWKASARLGKLQVNMMEYAASQRIMLVLMFGNEGEENPAAASSMTGEIKSEMRREYAISLTAGLAEYCLEQGIPVGLLSNGEDFEEEMPLRIEACGGRAGREGLLQGLSRLSFPRRLADMEKLLEKELAGTEASDGGSYVILNAGGGEEVSMRLAELCREYGKHCISQRIECQVTE